MNRDFEFRQLLRAYRAGIISEKTFEAEMAEIEHNGSANGASGGYDGLNRLTTFARGTLSTRPEKGRKPVNLTLRMQVVTLMTCQGKPE